MRRPLIVLAAAASAALVTACETAPKPPPPRAVVAAPTPPPPPTPAEEFAWSTQPGPNTLIARVAYQPVVGEVWSCAGLAVALMPETSYSRSRMQALYGSAQGSIQPVAQVRARSAANPGADYSQFVKSANCDAADTFTVANLPDGNYFAIVRVRQTRPAAPNEIVIMQRIGVRGGGPTRLTLPIGAPPPRPAPAPATPARPTPRRPAPR